MKKTFLLLILALGGLFFAGNLLFGQKSYLTTPQSNPKKVEKEIVPSKTLKSYTDPSGFSFSYPDNLSLVNIEATSSSTYADIQLTTKGFSGSLNLKIVDSKFKTVDDWVKTIPSQTPKETKLGNLRATEVSTDKKILLGSLDQGILFIVEVNPGSKKDFWQEVYKNVIADFSFTSSATTNSSSNDGVAFEGEEVVE